MIWASRWSVALRTFYRQILSVLYSSFPFGNFRPRLVRALNAAGKVVQAINLNWNSGKRKWKPHLIAKKSNRIYQNACLVTNRSTARFGVVARNDLQQSTVYNCRNFMHPITFYRSAILDRLIPPHNIPMSLSNLISTWQLIKFWDFTDSHANFPCYSVEMYWIISTKARNNPAGSTLQSALSGVIAIMVDKSPRLRGVIPRMRPHIYGEWNIASLAMFCDTTCRAEF